MTNTSLPAASTLGKRVARDKRVVQLTPAEGLDEALKHLLAQVAPHILLHALLVLCSSSTKDRDQRESRVPQNRRADRANDRFLQYCSTLSYSAATTQRDRAQPRERLSRGLLRHFAHTAPHVAL